MDCKIIAGESVVTQYRLLILDVRIRKRFRMIKRKLDPKIKWWQLKGNQGVFVYRVVHEADWIVQDDPNTTWNKIASCIKRVVKDVLSESRGGALPCKDTSWWNENVKAAIKIKRDSYRDLKKNCDGVSFERYKLAKKEAKKTVQNARTKVYKEVYEKLDTKEVEKDIYRIVQIRERKIRELCTMMRCVKNEDQKILLRDEIKENGESILTNCLMVVLLKTWMTLSFSTRI